MAITDNKTGLINPHGFCYGALDEIRDKMLRNHFNIGRVGDMNADNIFPLKMDDKPYNKINDSWVGYWTFSSGARIGFFMGS